MNWIKERRQLLGLTQRELVERLSMEGIEVSQSAIAHWETERFNIPLSEKRFREILAKVLKMSVQEILINEGYEVDRRYGKNAMKAADIVDQLDEGQQELALGMLEQFLKVRT